MASPASMGRHPIHPMIIPFPIALWIFSLVADVIYLWRGNPVWRNWIAFYTLLGGIIGAAVAAVPGFVDWLSIKDHAVVKLANWHARLNVIALVVFIIDFYLRTTRGASWVGGGLMIPLLLSIIGIILIAISGWLGGEMVYVHGVAVEPQHDAPRAEIDKVRTS
jgi:uncharacterized membrane protein